MNPRVVAVVVVVILTAGCSSFVDGEQATPTLTPAEVPTAERPADDHVGVAPGLSTSDVTHPAFLAESHADAAGRTSYVLRQRYHEDRAFGNVTSELDRTQRIVVENATVYRRDVSYRIEEMVDGELRSLHGYSEYADGEYLYRSWVASDGGRVFRRSPNPDQRRTNYAAINTGDIRQYLTVESATVTRHDVPTSDAQHYQVTGTRSSLPTIASVGNYTARAVIREDGFIRSLNVTYEAVDNGRDIEARYSVVYRDVGNATVTPPGWLAEARERIGNGTADTDRSKESRRGRG